LWIVDLKKLSAIRNPPIRNTAVGVVASGLEALRLGA
jgi:hypothetical protein